MARLLKYVGRGWLKLNTIDGIEVEGWIEPGDTMEFDPRLASQLLRESRETKLWEPASRTETE